MQNRPEGRNIFLKSYKSKGAYESKTAFKRKTAFLKSYKSKGAYALSHYPETRVLYNKCGSSGFYSVRKTKAKEKPWRKSKKKHVRLQRVNL